MIFREELVLGPVDIGHFLAEMFTVRRSFKEHLENLGWPGLI